MPHQLHRQRARRGWYICAFPLHRTSLLCSVSRCVVFPDAQTANDARRDLDRRGLFKGTRDFPASSASQSSKSSDIVHRLYPCRPPSPAHNATGNSSGVGRFDRDWDRDVKSDGAPSGGGTWREKRAKRAETRSDGEWTTVGSAAGLRGSDKPRNERKRDAWDDVLKPIRFVVSNRSFVVAGFT